MEGRVDGWVDGGMDGWTDEWMNGQMDRCLDGWVERRKSEGPQCPVPTIPFLHDAGMCHQMSG